MAQRSSALSGFKAGKFRVLVATDIAARGIDIADVSHVINFDCPHVPEDYVHRIGRTGRASATGDAFTFVAPDEESNLRYIEKTIGKRLPRVTLPDFDYAQKSVESLEIPIEQRIAAIRQRKAEERARREKSNPSRPDANGPRPFGRTAHSDTIPRTERHPRAGHFEQRSGGGRPGQQHSDAPRAFGSRPGGQGGQAGRSGAGQPGRRFGGKPNHPRSGPARAGGGVPFWQQRGDSGQGGRSKPGRRSPR